MVGGEIRISFPTISENLPKEWRPSKISPPLLLAPVVRIEEVYKHRLEIKFLGGHLIVLVNLRRLSRLEWSLYDEWTGFSGATICWNRSSRTTKDSLFAGHGSTCHYSLESKVRGTVGNKASVSGDCGGAIRMSSQGRGMWRRTRGGKGGGSSARVI